MCNIFIQNFVKIQFRKYSLTRQHFRERSSARDAIKLMRHIALEIIFPICNSRNIIITSWPDIGCGRTSKHCDDQYPSNLYNCGEWKNGINIGHAASYCRIISPWKDIQSGMIQVAKVGNTWNVFIFQKKSILRVTHILISKTKWSAPGWSHKQ